MKEPKLDPGGMFVLFRQAVEDELGRQMADFDIKEEVRKMIEAGGLAAAYKSLGFDNRWGRWEVDHTNGQRNAAYDRITAEAKAHAVKFFDEIVKQLPPPDKNILDAAKKKYKEVFEYEIGNMIRERARIDAQKMVAAIALPPEVTTDVGNYPT